MARGTKMEFRFKNGLGWPVEVKREFRFKVWWCGQEEPKGNVTYERAEAQGEPKGNLDISSGGQEEKKGI